MKCDRLRGYCRYKTVLVVGVCRMTQIISIEGGKTSQFIQKLHAVDE